MTIDAEGDRGAKRPFSSTLFYYLLLTDLNRRLKSAADMESVLKQAVGCGFNALLGWGNGRF